VTVDTPTLPWATLLLLGAAHGLNPAMGWLFAVGRGLLDRDRRALWGALGPLALGHALAVAAAVALAATLGQVLPLAWLRWVIAAALVAVGVDGLVRHRHVRLAGMRASARELATWSFLMASAHGAGLMVLPFVLGADVAVPAAHGHAHGHAETHAVLGAAAGDASALVAPLVHTAGYLLVTCALAVLVYEKVGLRVLRAAWINVNAIWCAALVAAGLAAALA
jgi:hypothetical protein